MKFYYQNNMGDNGTFKETDIVKAIYTAWNIEAELWLINDDVKKLNINNLYNQVKLVFAPLEDNQFNSGLLKEFGYYMEDGEGYREIKDLKTHKVKRYDWSEVRMLF